MLSSQQAASLLDIAADPSGHQAGDMIGRYKLVEKLGEGGFGIVWKATQMEPVKRDVALKIIRSDLESPSLVDRFNAERQTLARMAHSGIAGVLDADETVDGEPYFVMDLVHGQPITEFCEANQLSLRDRLSLFIQVCHSVQHAHQKFVLHRDLKPGNILASRNGDRFDVKVIDFGISKITSTEDIDGLILPRTTSGAIVGSLPYLAPELAIAGADANDSRVDVYSLGVVLYELATGTTPLASRPATETPEPLDSVLQRIANEAPVPPSALMRKRGGVTFGCFPCFLRNAVVELEEIILKAITKFPDNRYASPEDLAHDVECFLNNEPTSIAPKTLSYRACKLASRHRTAFISTGISTLALIVFAVFMTVSWARESEERRKANELRVQSETSERVARSEFERAEDVIRFLTDILDEAGSQIHAGKNSEALRAAMRKSEASIIRLKQQPLLKAQLQCQLASIYEAMDEFEDALDLRTPALPILEAAYGPNHNSVLKCRDAIASIYQNTSRHQIALEIFNDVAKRCEAANVKGSPLWFHAKRSVASCLSSLGRHAEAVEAVDTLSKNDLGNELASENSRFQLTRAQIHATAGDLKGAREIYDQTVELLKAKDTKSAKKILASALFSLGIIESKSGNFLEAAKRMEESIRMESKDRGSQNPRYIDVWIGTARQYQHGGKHADAMRCLQKAEQITKITGNERQTIHCLRARAEILQEAEQWQESLTCFRKLMPQIQDELERRPALYIELNSNIALINSKLGRNDEALASCVSLWDQMNSTPAIKDDRELWQSALTHFVEIAEAATERNSGMPDLKYLPAWKEKLTELNAAGGLTKPSPGV